MSEKADNSIRMVWDTPDPFAKLPALAERLGVKEYKDSPGTATVTLNTKDGKQYCLFELINAALDRLE